MTKFVDDDDGYMRWLRSNQKGWVVNSTRKPNPRYLMLHRATCRTITGRPARGTLWTKDYMKKCSSSREKLETWTRRDVGGNLRPCQLCTG